MEQSNGQQRLPAQSSATRTGRGQIGTEKPLELREQRTTPAIEIEVSDCLI